jgi:hypothetical protein
MYFKEVCAGQNYPSLYEGALEVNYCADGSTSTNRNNTPFVTPPRKDTNHLSCSVLYFIKCLQTRETTIAFLTSTLEGFSKTKTHQKKKWVLMRLNATTLTDKKQICNFKHTEETKTLYQVKNKINSLL